MRERSVAFGSDMIRAILARRKTETRRVVKPSATLGDPAGWTLVPDPGEAGPLHQWSPYGQPGDRLWVREAWRFEASMDALTPREGLQQHQNRPTMLRKFEADGQVLGTPNGDEEWGRYRNARFMPRPLSRILLAVEEVRMERLHDLDAAGAQAEGASRELAEGLGERERTRLLQILDEDGPVAMFAAVWERINGPRGYGWDSNPWVWVVRFEPLDAPSGPRANGVDP